MNFYADDDDTPTRERRSDPLTEALGAPGYRYRHVVDECVEHFEGSNVHRPPERFDRFYWQPERLLIDVVQDGTPDMLEQDRARKHVDFKTAWCRKHGWLYLVVPESESENGQRIRELLAEAKGERPVEVADADETPRPARRRGAVQRPKATA